MKTKKKNDKILIWTRAYHPFIMGGNVNQPIGTEIDKEDYTPIELGRKFPELLRKRIYKYKQGYYSDIYTKILETNDNISLTKSKREKELIQLFEQLNIQVRFIG